MDETAYWDQKHAEAVELLASVKRGEGFIVVVEGRTGVGEGDNRFFRNVAGAAIECAEDIEREQGNRN